MSSSSSPNLASLPAVPSSSSSSSSSTPTGDGVLPIKSGHSSQQGRRPTMEDEVVLESSFTLPPPFGAYSFFGVFDGHGGRAAAIFTRDHILALVQSELSRGIGPGDALANAYVRVDALFIDECKRHDDMRMAALAAAERIATAARISSAAAAAASSSQQLDTPITMTRAQSVGLAVKLPFILPPSHSSSSSSSAPFPPEKDNSGTTAVSMLLHHSSYTLYVANVGDSRAVLSSSSARVLALTNDHKADRPDEVDRIRRAGGFVVHKRVMGELAISRAIGDLDFKETGFEIVVPNPEVCKTKLTKEDEFVLLACDGIFDVMTNEVACAFVRDSLASGVTLDVACERIVSHAINVLHTNDNVTVIVVQLPTVDELRSHNSDALAAAEQAVYSTKAVLMDSHVPPTPLPPIAMEEEATIDIPTTSSVTATPIATSTTPVASLSAASTPYAAPSASVNIDFPSFVLPEAAVLELPVSSPMVEE